MQNSIKLVVQASLAVLLCACGTFSGPAPQEESLARNETLTLIVAELRMNLREDPYRFPRPVTADGRDLFRVILWKLDRLARERDRTPENWANVDFVIEFARASTLERLRRYAAAGAAYERVADSGSVLADLGMDSARDMARFAENASAPDAPLDVEAELELIEARIHAWRGLAAEHRGTPRSALAWEEVEAWQSVRVDWLVRHGSAQHAIIACRRVIEHNRDSKLAAQHLIRLGDLYADAARRTRLHQRAKLEPTDEAEYEEMLASAFSAYELAVEDRHPGQRREAETKIEALMAFHEGARHAP